MRIIAIIMVTCWSMVGLTAQDEDTDYIEVKDTIIDASQNDLEIFKTKIQGQVMTAMITEDGDTLIMADLEDVSITSLRSFKSDEDYRKYLKFKHYAAVVYPYAKEAIRIFKETEHVTNTMSKRKRKKHIKRLEKELKKEFQEPLVRLTKLQGKIMMKMIERELDKPMFELIAGTRGKFTAMYWNNFAKLYSYDLKEGYNYGDYPILDAVLQDFDVSYRIEQDKLNSN